MNARTLIATAFFAVLGLLATPSARAGDGPAQGPVDPIKELQRILEKMEVVEDLLAKTKVKEGAKLQDEIIKALEDKVKAGEIKQDELLDDIDKQLKVVLKRMRDIDKHIEKVIRSIPMKQGQGQGGMEMKPQGGNKPKDGQGEKRTEEDKNLKEMRKNGQDKQNGKQGKEETKGGKSGKEGDKAADRPYSANGKDADGSAPRAEGSDRWGFLPLKKYMEALASGKVKVPEKYEGLIKKYMEMLAKKSAEEGK